MASRAAFDVRGGATLACSAALLVTFAASPALAAPKGPSAADRETARSLLEQGRSLADHGDMKGALARFKGADDIMHVPSTAIRVAKAQAAVGLLVEARDTISGIQRMPVEKNEPAPFREARAEAEQLDATLAPRIPSLTVTASGAATGEDVTLTLDGVELPAGVVGLPRVVDPGHHTIAAKTPTTAGSQEVDVKEAEQKKVDITLVATGAPPVVAADHPETSEAATTKKRVHSPTVVTWAGAGFGGVGLIAGTVTGILVLGKKSSLKSECPAPSNVCNSQGDSTLSSANTLATVSTISFVAAGVGAGVAIVSLAVGHDQVVAGGGEPTPDPAAPPPETPAATSFRITPWFTGFAGGVTGTF